MDPVPGRDSADALTSLEAGVVVAGRYRVECLLGTGGMGAVRLDTPESRVAGRFYAARALIHLGNEAQACTTLRAAAPEAGGTPFAEAVRTLLDAGC
jgi:hypothetical protein